MNKDIIKIISLISLSSVFSLPVYAGKKNFSIEISPCKDRNFNQDQNTSTPMEINLPYHYQEKGFVTPKKKTKNLYPRINLTTVFVLVANPRLRPFINSNTGLINNWKLFLKKAKEMEIEPLLTIIESFNKAIETEKPNQKNKKCEKYRKYIKRINSIIEMRRFNKKVHKRIFKRIPRSK